MSKPRSPHAHGPSEIWTRPAIRAAIDGVQGALAARLRTLRLERGLSQEEASERAGLHSKHVQRMEKGSANATVATLAALGHAYGVTMGDFFSGAPAAPFTRIPESSAQPHRNCVPLYSLQAAAGRFGALQVVEEESPEAWVIPNAKTPIARGLFVAQVTGRSMDRRIPDGAFCLFRAPVRRPRSGQVLLVQHRDARDPEHGGQFTVKVFRTRGERVFLEPDSTDARYLPRELEGDDLQAIAELVEVLPGAPTR